MVRNHATEDQDPTPAGGVNPCPGNDGACLFCIGQELLYWCDSCGQAVAEKRCPLCGLKARKMRGNTR